MFWLFFFLIVVVLVREWSVGCTSCTPQQLITPHLPGISKGVSDELLIVLIADWEVDCAAPTPRA